MVQLQAIPSVVTPKCRGDNKTIIPLNTVFLLGPIFSAAESLFHNEFERILHHHCNCIVQSFHRTLQQKTLHRKTVQHCLDIMRRCDATIVILDGIETCDFVSYACGFLRAVGKPTVGVRTDTRYARSSSEPVLFGSEYLCDRVVTNTDHDDLIVLGKQVRTEIDRLLRNQ